MFGQHGGGVDVVATNQEVDWDLQFYGLLAKTHWASEENCDIDEDTGHNSAGAEIVLQMSHTILIRLEKYVK